MASDQTGLNLCHVLKNKVTPKFSFRFPELKMIVLALLLHFVLLTQNNKVILSTTLT